MRHSLLPEQACKGALQKLGPLMKSKRINEMFQKHLNPEESLLYPDFLNDLCKLIVSCVCVCNFLNYTFFTRKRPLPTQHLESCR